MFCHSPYLVRYLYFMVNTVSRNVEKFDRSLVDSLLGSNPAHWYQRSTQISYVHKNHQLLYEGIDDKRVYFYSGAVTGGVSEQSCLLRQAV